MCLLKLLMKKLEIWVASFWLASIEDSGLLHIKYLSTWLYLSHFIALCLFHFSVIFYKIPLTLITLNWTQPVLLNLLLFYLMVYHCDCLLFYCCKHSISPHAEFKTLHLIFSQCIWWYCNDPNFYLLVMKTCFREQAMLVLWRNLKL